jgi:hypothetical protein
MSAFALFLQLAQRFPHFVNTLYTSRGAYRLPGLAFPEVPRKIHDSLP